MELTGDDLYRAFGAESMAERNGLYIVSDNIKTTGRNCNVSYGTLDSGSYEQGLYQDQHRDNPYVVRDQAVASNSVLPLHVIMPRSSHKLVGNINVFSLRIIITEDRDERV